MTLLRGIAQLAFSDSARGGVLLLFGLFLVSPQAGAGALLGAGAATLVHRLLGAYGEEEWRLGLSGYIGAVMGFLWSGLMAGPHRGLSLLFPLSLFACFLFEFLLRKLSQRVLLPILTLPAVLAGWLTAVVFSRFGMDFWQAGAPAVAGDAQVFLGVLLIAATLFLTDVAASIQAVLLSLAAALFGRWFYGLDMIALSGLWGYTVAAASFGAQAVFFRGATSASIAGLVAVAIGGAAWMIWMASPFLRTLPPLLFPFILGVWSVLLLARKVDLAVLYPHPRRLMGIGQNRGR